MGLVALGVCLFVGFVFLFLLLTPRPSAAGALLQEAVKPVRPSEQPVWRTALDVDYLAKPFTIVRSLFAPEPDPKLVRRLKDILDLQLADERKSHYLQSDGHYARSSQSAQPDAIDSQLTLLTDERAPIKSVKGLTVLSRKRRVRRSAS